ncbi:MAG: hypothetical protein E7B29_22490 [Mixta calida]|nr:hypothetical protein [Mixta calida]
MSARRVQQAQQARSVPQAELTAPVLAQLPWFSSPVGSAAGRRRGWSRGGGRRRR